MIRKKIKIILEWASCHKIETLFLLFIIAVAAFLRLYKISEYMTFLGDEGRDVIIVRRLIVDFDPILIGPGTSIGNMYLGPLYYYLIAPALLLANLSPVGPAVMVALLGILTVWFLWFVARELFPLTFNSENIKSDHGVHWGALFASFLYAISPVIVNYSRSSWNPNIMPFFALLSIYGIWKTAVFRSYKWLFVLGISVAFMLQSHYLGLLMIPILGLFYAFSSLKLWQRLKKAKSAESVEILKKDKKAFLLYSFLGIGIFLFLMSPLVVFDARHGWQNFNAIKTFFTERQTTVSARPWSGIPKAFPIYRDDFISRIIGGNNKTWGQIIAYGILALGIVYLIKYSKEIVKLFKGIKLILNRNEVFAASLLITLIWGLVSFIGLGLYKQHIYDHYFGFVYPVPYLLLGAFIQELWLRKVWRIIVIISFLLLVFANIKVNHLQYPPNRQLQRAEEIAAKIKAESGGNKLNLAVIAERNYEDGYQYFVERWQLPYTEIDPLRIEETIAPQLFVVCELPKAECNPVNSPKAEIANFGWSKITGEWEIAGVALYKLEHVELEDEP